MRPFITFFWMIHTGTTYHLHDRREGVSAVFTGVFGFLTTFIEFVAASVGAVGMARAGSADELSDVSEAVTAVFAIVILHSFVSNTGYCDNHR